MGGWSAMGNFFGPGVDYLGLRTALADRLLPILVGAMSFMAALALAGALAASSLAAQWQADTSTALTVQVPDPQAPSTAPALTRLAEVEVQLRAAPGVTGLHMLSAAEETKLLQPWLGQDVGALALPVPAVFTATWIGGDSSGLARALDNAAPGALVETGTAWASRAELLTASLQDCAEVLLLIVALVAAAIVSVATRAGLAQRREAIEIIHFLGAMDADIADRFAARATLLAAAGAAGGAVLALAALLVLARLAAPFGAIGAHGGGLPVALWIALPVLPFIAALIGWCTAQLTVRGWLHRLA
jgi:cell division transport system permease protein